MRSFVWGRCRVICSKIEHPQYRRTPYIRTPPFPPNHEPTSIHQFLSLSPVGRIHHITQYPVL